MNMTKFLIPEKPIENILIPRILKEKHIIVIEMITMRDM
ncbi:hypothetical protein SJ_175 [Proteus phage SJ_PmiM]|nr:hypothetical protein SJ_175 [Proteus phage SJ_PmiM]